LSLNFTRITSGSTVDVGSLLQVNVAQAGTGHVSFDFRNNAVAYPGSFIAQVFFDDLEATPLLSSPAIQNYGTVQFAAGGSPGSLPSGNNASPVFDTDLRFSAESPKSGNGIHPYGAPDPDHLTLTFAGSYDAVVSALIDSSLRIGLHVQGLPASTGTISDSFISHYVPPPTEHSVPPAVPAPAGVALCGIGLSVLGALRRRFA
jgi:hypothetical protein